MKIKQKVLFILTIISLASVYSKAYSNELPRATTLGVEAMVNFVEEGQPRVITKTSKINLSSLSKGIQTNEKECFLFLDQDSPFLPKYPMEVCLQVSKKTSSKKINDFNYTLSGYEYKTSTSIMNYAGSSENILDSIFIEGDLNIPDTLFDARIYPQNGLNGYRYISIKIYPIYVTDSDCHAQGKDCSIENACVTNKSFRPEAINHNDYYKAINDVASTPENISKYPHIYYR